MWKTWVRSLGWEALLEKGTATHSSILAWRIPWTTQSMGPQRVGRDWATFTFTYIRERPKGQSGTRVCPILPLTCLFILDQVHTLIVWIIMPILLVTIFLSFWLLFALFSILDCYPFLESLLTKQLFVPDYISQCFSLCYMSTVDCFSVAYNYGTTYTSLDWRHGRRGTGIELGSMQLKVYQQCIFVNYLKASTVPYDANFKISYAICCEFGGTNETQQVYPLKIGLCKIYHAGQTVKMRGFQKW